VGHDIADWLAKATLPPEEVNVMICLSLTLIISCDAVL
jgi:hypothetical protein